MVTFIALEARYCNRRHLTPTLPLGLPKFKRDIICYGITAEHTAFQRLVLLNVLKILGIRIDLKSLTRLAPIHLAQLVYCYFERDGLSWSTKGEEGLLTIVRSPDLRIRTRRNYVAEKTRHHISAMIRHYRKFNP